MAKYKMKKNDCLTVYFDGSCPICSKEISLYKKQKGASEIYWIDASKASLEHLPANITRSTLLKRFHVADSEGNFFVGGNAFLKLWENLTYFRILSKILSIPPLAWIVNTVYDKFLIYRPRLQNLFK
jgi:predicted DCC family thiol-disulfide oxidoreductase YuxK